MNRRVFLKNGGMALVSLGFAPAFIARAAASTPATRKGKVLVAIFQRGAVDGLNMVVPFGERSYYDARPTIAIERPGLPNGAIDLDGFFGLHPRMASLAPLFKRGELALVHATGSPDSTRSHFDAQDYMETATPGVKSTRDGWLNRYLHAREHADATPFRAVAVAPELPRSLQGIAPALAIARLDGFGIRAGAETEAIASTFESEYAAAADQLLSASAREGFDAVRMLKHADPARSVPSNGAEYPQSAFGDALREVAQLVKADVGLEVAFAETGNWDHHVNEGAADGQLGGRLDDLSRAIAALATDLGDRMADVLVITMSEFGRAVAENGNRGTDHGHGNVMLIAGGSVRGGRVYGKWPGLLPEQCFDGRDLAVTTDFRDVFAEIVVRHLGVDVRDATAVFPGHRVDERNFRDFLSA